jgi:hypothetical protein
MSIPEGTYSHGRAAMAIAAGLICIALACTAALNAGPTDVQTNHPCSRLTASYALDVARYGTGDGPGGLVVGSYSVEGAAFTGSHVFLTPLGRSDSAEFLAGAFGADGTSHFTDVRPGRYEIKVSGFGFEDHWQNVRIMAARTDTVCFVMRRSRLSDWN